MVPGEPGAVLAQNTAPEATSSDFEGGMGEADDTDEDWRLVLAAPYRYLPGHTSEEACPGAELYLLGLQLQALVEMIEARLVDQGIPTDGLQSWPTQHEIAASLCQGGWLCCRQARQEALAALHAAAQAARRRRC